MISTTENLATGISSLADIEHLAGSFADDYNGLRAIAADIQAEQAAILKKYLAGLRKAAARSAASRALLVTSVEQHPELFADKKTQTFHGIKVGFRKGKGALEITDETLFLKKLEQMFPVEAERGAFLHVEITPNKPALAELPAADLRRLGVQVTDTGDVVVVKPVAGDVDKFVAGLLAEKNEE